jgi:hypothetical protein
VKLDKGEKENLLDEECAVPRMLEVWVFAPFDLSTLRFWSKQGWWLLNDVPKSQILSFMFFSLPCRGLLF